MVSSGLSELLVAFASFTLVGLTLLGGIASIWLLIVKWGRWRLLLSTLAPSAVTIGFVTAIVLALVEATRRGAGIPDAIEVAVGAAVVTAACLLLACVVVIFAALIEKRRWGVIATLTAAPVVLFVLMTGALFLAYEQASEPVATSGELWAPMRTAKPLPGEFAQAAIAPKVARPESSVDEAEDSEKRPDWVNNGSPDPNQAVHSAGPTVLLADAERDARRSLARWAWDEIARDWSDTQPQPPEWWYDAHGLYPVVDRFEETRETSVGTVYFVHLLGEVSPEDRGYWEREIGRRLGASRSMRNTRYIALGGAGVLALLGVTHLVLRRGVEPDKNNEQPTGEP